MNSAAENEEILRARDLSKQYGGHVVLNSVNLAVRKSEIHAIVGENGAGKTTLISILGGIVQPTGGDFLFDGEVQSHIDPQRSRDIGISIIHQDFPLIPTLSVAENIFLGKLKDLGWSLLPRKHELENRARRVLASLGEECVFDPGAQLSTLPSSQQQLVEIAKALVEEPKLLIMDEPTTALTESEVQTLFAILRDLIAKGMSIIYISHKLDEVFDLSSRITVLRDGQCIGTRSTAEATIDEIISMMVGRSLDLYHIKGKSEARPDAQTMLEVRDLAVKSLVHGVSFIARSGEILGFAGLIGAGRSEVAQAIFGCYRHRTGSILVAGKDRDIRSCRDAMLCGIAYLPEDRKSQGVIRTTGVRENMSLASLKAIAPLGLPNRKKEIEMVKSYIRLLNIKMADINAPILSLSGGNQQKVVFAKWLATKARILIVDEPTRGIDIGAKAEIHSILKELAGQGIAVILISSELPELLSLSDRIIVMRQGRIAGEMDIAEADQERIMHLATVGVEEKSGGRGDCREDRA
jgi:ABC-type sugar transport system ATPase subunit